MQPSSPTFTTPSSLDSLGSCDSGFRADRISDGECTIALTVSVLFSESFMKSLLEMGLKKLLMLLPAAAVALVGVVLPEVTALALLPFLLGFSSSSSIRFLAGGDLWPFSSSTSSLPFVTTFDSSMSAFFLFLSAFVVFRLLLLLGFFPLTMPDLGLKKSEILVV